MSTHITERRIEWINEIIRFICEYFAELEQVLNYTSGKENINKLKYLTNQIKIRLCYENDSDDTFIKLMHSINYLLDVSVVFECKLEIGYVPESFIPSDINRIRRKQLFDIELRYKRLMGLANLPVVNNSNDNMICSEYNSILANLQIRLQSYQDDLLIKFEEHIRAEWSRVKYETAKGTTKGFLFQEALKGVYYG